MNKKQIIALSMEIHKWHSKGHSSASFFFFLVKRATRFLLVVPTRFDVRWQDETLLLHKKTSTTSRNSPRVSKSSDKIFFEVI